MASPRTGERAAFELAGQRVAAGEQRLVDLPVSKFSTHTPVTLPVRVLHGRQAGPTLFVSAAIHGDEILGVEIIRRLVRAPALKRLKGTLLCVPIVNVFGFVSHSRYLPDRRDLNRSFPGTPNGSLAAQLAHIFTKEIISRANVGIDIHSAAINRSNLPQMRVDFAHAKALELADAFGVPVVVNSPARAGSLRLVAHQHGVDVLVYEAGEALRFDELAVRAGVKGVLRVMRTLGMVAARGITERGRRIKPVHSRVSAWVRAPESGILRAFKAIGDTVAPNDVVGVIDNPFEEIETEVRAPDAGLIIGRTNLPVVNQGDALFHIARVPSAATAARKIGAIETELGGDPMFDEDEII